MRDRPVGPEDTCLRVIRRSSADWPLISSPSPLILTVSFAVKSRPSAGHRHRSAVLTRRAGTPIRLLTVVVSDVMVTAERSSSLPASPATRKMT